MSRTRHILFIQGGGAGVHDEWDNRLVDSLVQALGPDWPVRYPRMPDEDDPHFAPWKAAIGEELEALPDGAVVVGHSIGGTFLINALAERARSELGMIVLISAPFVGEGGWPGDEFETPPDLGAKLPEGVPVHLFQGLDDDTTPPEHADLYGRAIPDARVHKLPGRDHQLGNDLGKVAEAIRGLGECSMAR